MFNSKSWHFLKIFGCIKRVYYNVHAFLIGSTNFITNIFDPSRKGEDSGYSWFWSSCKVLLTRIRPSQNLQLLQNLVWKSLKLWIEKRFGADTTSGTERHDLTQGIFEISESMRIFPSEFIRHATELQNVCWFLFCRLSHERNGYWAGLFNSATACYWEYILKPFS